MVKTFFKRRLLSFFFKPLTSYKTERYRKNGERDAIFINAKDILPTSSKFNNYSACRYRPDAIS
jgi:hypothetical protein